MPVEIIAWNHEENFRRRAEGDSYISLPLGLPPSPHAIRVFTIQGILGVCVWGGGRWFTNPAAEQMVAEGQSNLIPMIMPTDVRSAEKGNMYARSLVEVAYPKYITIDETEYILEDREWAEGLMYIDQRTGEDRLVRPEIMKLQFEGFAGRTARSIKRKGEEQSIPGKDNDRH